MIQVKELRKTFRSKDRKSKGATVEAVRSINFAVQKGEIFGLLGPNGAGKTTTMRMLCTLLSPTSGTATIAGYGLLSQQESVRKRIGYVSQVGGMEREASGRENLLLQARLYGMSKSAAQARIEGILGFLQLETFADRRTGTYSRGQRRIFDLASGIVHEPQLLFLDEPSTGLDPQNRAHVWEQVKKLNERGATIFLSTHGATRTVGVERPCIRQRDVGGGGHAQLDFNPSSIWSCLRPS
jgi:ABC-2 type transport system ATP-binding protein